MTRYQSAFTTVDAVNRLLSKADPGTSPSPEQSQYDDYYNLMTDVIWQSSNFIQRSCRRTFVPYYDSVTFYMYDFELDPPHYYQSSAGRWQSRQRLILHDDLLVTSSITWNGTALSSTEWRELEPRHLPYWAIEFDPNSANTSVDLDTYTNGVVVAGTWGYHDNTTQMWSQVETGVTVADDTTTSISVADAALYEILQYIKLESEYCQITGLNTTTDVLTVKRGVNGTTAAAHAAVAVSKFIPVYDIQVAATRLSAWMYEHRSDARVQFSDGGTLDVNVMPVFIKDTIQRLRRYGVVQA